MVYDIQQLGQQPIDWHSTSRQDRRAMIERVLKQLHEHLQMPERVHISPAATSGDQARQLWQQLQQQRHPLSQEGAIFWPQSGIPSKSKFLEEHDVHVQNVFPGAGGLTGRGAGGFEYALQPNGPTVGRVGTGFDLETRRQMHEDPQAFQGRVARIRAPQQFSSGAYRAPAFLAWHEDYPVVKAGAFLWPAAGSILAESDIPSELLLQS